MRHFKCVHGKSHFRAVGSRFITKENGQFSTENEELVKYLLQNPNFCECFKNGDRMKLRDIDERDMESSAFKKKYAEMDKITAAEKKKALGNMN